jgi:hypothetical protein
MGERRVLSTPHLDPPSKGRKVVFPLFPEISKRKNVGKD